MAVERVCLGAIAGAYGVRGEVRLKSFCARAEDIAAYGAVETEDGTRRFDVVLGHPVAGGLSARLSGVGNRDAAEALRGLRLFVPRARMPALPDDEFYHADLIGLEAADTGGVVLGKVAAVLNHGAGDILEVRGPQGTLLLPFTRAVVPTVDLTVGRLIVDLPPEGEE